MSSKLLTDLPSELLCMIGSFLDWESALRLTAASKGLRAAFAGEAYWLEHLHSAGFGVPNDHRDVRSAKEHLFALSGHKTRCFYCEAAWKLIMDRPAATAAAIAGEYAMQNNWLPAALCPKIDNTPSIPLAAAYPGEVGWVFLCLDARMESHWLGDHPLLGSRLISVEPLFHVQWVIEERYYSLNSAGQKIYPNRDRWTYEDLHAETAAGGSLDNSKGITVDDVLKALTDRLKDGALPAGSTNLRCLELRGPGELVVVFGDIESGPWL